MTQRSHVIVVAVIGIALVGLLWSRAASGTSSEHSGIVMMVDPSARAVVVRELGVEGKPRTLALKIPAQARILLSERLPDAEVTDLSRPFRDTPIELSDLRRGDFVVVESTPDEVGRVAHRITVTLRNETR